MNNNNNSSGDSIRINKEQQEKKQMSKPNETGGVRIEGHIKIWDPSSGEIIVNKRNAIHYENFSESLAQSVGNQQQGWIHEMSFGNGGTNVDPTGIITYLPTNTSGSNAALYNQTYYKVIDVNSVYNTDPTRNKIEVRHVPGTVYTDVLVTCLLDYGEPSGQQAFDNSTNFSDTYVFDELGLRSYNSNGVNTGKLLTHVIFHPVQKSLNRLIQIDYTVRIQTLTNLSSQL
jgi:hypothetical protein